MHRPKLDASHSAVRALSVSAYDRGCMWYVSAPHRPCIGHRTGYSLHVGHARMPGFSGLASADFEGFLHTATSGAAPAFFYARCADNMADYDFSFFCCSSRADGVMAITLVRAAPYHRAHAHPCDDGTNRLALPRAAQSQVYCGSFACLVRTDNCANVFCFRSHA